MSQHPELAVLRGDLSVAGSGSNSDAEVEMASRQVISEDLERTTREVISEDRGSWGTIKPLTNLQPPLMHTSHYVARVCRLAAAMALVTLCKHGTLRGSRLAARSDGRPVE